MWVDTFAVRSLSSSLFLFFFSFFFFFFVFVEKFGGGRKSSTIEATRLHPLWVRHCGGNAISSFSPFIFSLPSFFSLFFFFFVKTNLSRSRPVIRLHKVSAARSRTFSDSSLHIPFFFFFFFSLVGKGCRANGSSRHITDSVFFSFSFSFLLFFPFASKLDPGDK